MASAAASAPVATPPAPTPAPAARALSRWQAVDWSELPGFEADRLLQAWPALALGCQKPLRPWADVCRAVGAGAPADEGAARAFLRARLQPWRVEGLDGRSEGLITGYFEPLIEARRVRDAAHRVPLYALPPALRDRTEPWHSRREIDTRSDVRDTLAGLELAWLSDPLDALMLQVQGSGRLRVTERDGRVRTVRLAYAGHNAQPYKSVARWLIEQGELAADAASWPAVRAWAQVNPERVNQLLWANPRVVFFREEPLPDATVGPKGAMGVPLTPQRSIAVDPTSVPYGAWVWIDTTEPLGQAPLRRLVTAQDTGSAITGAVRADYFWGWGDEALAYAGRMKQPLRMWVLWPRGAPLPNDPS